MSEHPKVTVHCHTDGREPRVFFGEDEFPHEIWMVKAEDGFGEPSVTIRVPASAVEFKRVD